MVVVVVYCGFICWTHRICRLNLLQPALFRALVNQKTWTLHGYLGAFLLVMVSIFPPCMFNYITLIDTLLYINCVKLGNQAAMLSQTIALLS